METMTIEKRMKRWIPVDTTPIQYGNWRDVIGYEGLYKVNDVGEIFSLRKGGRILKPKVNPKSKYFEVGLCKLKIKKTKVVHRLVAEAFLGPPRKGLVVNHIDANPQNNHISNLEFVTQKENMQHASKMGLFHKNKK